MDFSKTAVIISGGSKGIGLSIAKIFASESHHPIILIARNEIELEAAAVDCQERGAEEVYTISADLTDEKSVREIVIPGHLKVGILVGFTILSFYQLRYPLYLDENHYHLQLLRLEFYYHYYF